MANSFVDNLKLSAKSAPLVDEIYRKSFRFVDTIKRYSKDDNLILDKTFHIDTTITTKLGTTITLQEKVLRHEFSKYNTLTMEFEQNRFTGEYGEFFHLASQYYFSGYWNEDETAIDKWIIINLPSFFDAYLNKLSVELGDFFDKHPQLASGREDYILSRLPDYLPVRPSGDSRASFFYLDYSEIPESCIYRASFKENKNG